MPKHGEACHRIVDLLDEARVETFDTRDSRAPFALSAAQDQTRSAEQLTGEAPRDSAHHVETFLLSHGADDSTNHRTGGPAPLFPPVAWTLHLRRGNPRMNDFD